VTKQVRVVNGFVTGHGFSRAETAIKKGEGFSPCHGASRPQCIAVKHPQSRAYVLFNDKHEHGERLLQSERNAGLLIDVLRSLVAERRFKLHDFVIMPDHVHLLSTVEDGMTVEKAMQLIKGRFSHRLSHEFGHKGEVWQRGFSEVASDEPGKPLKRIASISGRIQ
jgi:REP element-mobilizing transposase RayT